MSLSRDSREVKKWKAARRAQFRLKQRFDAIDFEEDVLIPEVEALRSGRVRAEIGESSSVIDVPQISIEVLDAPDSDDAD